MILSILIPTVPQRKEVFKKLHNELFRQIHHADALQKVEVLFDPAPVGAKTTGEKRDELLMRARAKYIWFIDDDDDLFPYSIGEVLKAAETDCDCMAINGVMTTDGRNEKKWYIAINNPYQAEFRGGEEIYLRYPNHITPMKRELVNKFRFKYVSNFEDKDWADQIKAAGVLKSETVIERPIYHYKYSQTNKLYV